MDGKEQTQRKQPITLKIFESPKVPRVLPHRRGSKLVFVRVLFSTLRKLLRYQLFSGTTARIQAHPGLCEP